MLWTVSGVTSTCQYWSAASGVEEPEAGSSSELASPRVMEGIWTKKRLRPKLAKMATTIRQVMAMAMARRF